MDALHHMILVIFFIRSRVQGNARGAVQGMNSGARDSGGRGVLHGSLDRAGAALRHQDRGAGQQQKDHGETGDRLTVTNTWHKAKAPSEKFG